MITMREYKAGEVIFRENEPGGMAYVIERGRVEVTKMLGEQTIHLVYLETGEPFGEMSMLDDQPRSATVTAVEETLVREIERDHFFRLLQTEPDIGINLLKVLVARLRRADARLMQLYEGNLQGVHQSGARSAETRVKAGTLVLLEGLTARAIEALPANPFQISTFPFRIGRKSKRATTGNDLTIPDVAPLQISRHHLTLFERNGRIGVTDRGSRMGTIVDGQQVGGPGGSPGPVFFSGSEGILVLGEKRSPFKYKVTIHQQSPSSG